MNALKFYRNWLSICLVLVAAATANAQTFKVQCPTTTTLHPVPGPSGSYTGPATLNDVLTAANGALVDYVDSGGAVKCQQLSGGDGFATMADGTQTYLFAFGPLSALEDIRNGLPGTALPSEYNLRGDMGAVGDPGFTTFNGAVGLICDPDGPSYGDPACDPDTGPFTGHVDPRAIMDVGIMNGNMPAPMIAIDEDDELFLTLTNVGQIMRPDLFEEHTVHFHGYPNASAFYDGVPDASLAISIGGSFTYYYLAPEAGTYFWHCHVTPPEHLQMGMVGQLYVRPRQNRVPASTTLYDALVAQQSDLRTKCGGDILCPAPLPAGGDNGAVGGFVDGAPTKLFAYNDGDGSTSYDVEYPIQMHGFDPNFHFVSMTFNPVGFADMKDKYFLLNGRGYPDTVAEGTMRTQSADGVEHPSQPLPTIINIPKDGKALLRLSDLDVTEYQTLASLGIPMRVIAQNARLLRDLDGNDLTYYSNSITMAGGESMDVILDACSERALDGSCNVSIPDGTYALFTPNLDHLSNDAENFGGMMTEVHICPGAVNPVTKACL